MENTLHMNGTRQEYSGGVELLVVNTSERGLNITLTVFSIILFIESLSIVLKIIPRKRLHTGTNVLILSHACATLFASACAIVRLGMALAIISSSLHVCKLLTGLTNCGGLLQLANTLLLSLERFVAMKYPLYHHRYITMRNVLVIITLLWVIIILLSITSFTVFITSVDNISMETNNCHLLRIIPEKSWMDIIITFLLACLISFLFYIYVYTMVLLKQNLRVLSQSKVHADLQRRGQQHLDNTSVEPQRHQENNRESNFARSENTLRKDVRLTAICIVPVIASILSYTSVLVLVMMCKMGLTICQSALSDWLVSPVLILNTVNTAIHCYRLKTFQSPLALFRSQHRCAHRVHNQSEPDSRIATVAESAYHTPREETSRHDIFMVAQEYSISKVVRSSPA